MRIGRLGARQGEYARVPNEHTVNDNSQMNPRGGWRKWRTCSVSAEVGELWSWAMADGQNKGIGATSNKKRSFPSRRRRIEADEEKVAEVVDFIDRLSVGNEQMALFGRCVIFFVLVCLGSQNYVESFA